MFLSHHGLYIFAQVPLFLRNAQETVARAMDVILSPLKWHFSMVFLDDIIVVSPCPDKRITQVRQLLNLLRNVDVTLNLVKRIFIPITIDYLGHVI